MSNVIYAHTHSYTHTFIWFGFISCFFVCRTAMIDADMLSSNNCDYSQRSRQQQDSYMCVSVCVFVCVSAWSKTQFKLYLFPLFCASQAQLPLVFRLSRAHLSGFTAQVELEGRGGEGRRGEWQLLVKRASHGVQILKTYKSIEAI